MKTLCRTLSLALLLVPAVASAAINAVQRLEVTGDEKSAQVAITGSSAPTFTVFRLSEPARVVIDLNGADISAVRGLHDGRGLVNAVTVSQFSDERVAVARVVVAIADEARYDVRANGNQVLVSVFTGAETQPSAPRAEAAPAKAEPAPEAVAAAPAAAPGDVLNARRDEKTVSNPGHRLTGIKQTRKNGQFLVNLNADGEVGTFDLIELGDPPRLAIDLVGFEKGLKGQKVDPAAPLKDIRFGKHDDKVRVVLEAKDGDRMPAYDVTRTREGLQIAFRPKASEAVAVVKPVPAEEKKVVEAGPVAVARAERPRAKRVNVRDVAFRGDESKGRVVIGVPEGTEYRIARPDAHTAVLTLTNANLPKKLERSLDTSAFGGPVKMVSSFSAPGQPDTVQIVATLDGKVDDKAVFEKGQLSWEFDAPRRTAQLSSEILIDGHKVEAEEAAVAPRTSGFAAEAPAYVQAGSARRSKYSGRKVSFEFKDIDIHNLLRIIGEVSKRNMIVADDVKGKVTIRLRNVPWDQALDEILKSKNLGKEDNGNIIRVAPLHLLEEERRTAEAMQKARLNSEPLKVRLIPVNYAVAADVSPKVKDLLSERGSMSVDTRTNVIIVKDTLDALARAEGLVRKLDTQTPQVLIESRIVEMNSHVTRELGVQWGGALNFGPSFGNATGLVFPNAIKATGGSADSSAGSTAGAIPWAVDLPAATGAGSGGGVNFAFGSAGGAAMLNLRLTALETSGQMKTISAPKVTTLDNTAATVGQGYAIPFSQLSASGVNTMFIEAKLELKVTPHVTSDGSVLMNIHATNNQPDTSLSGANGQPAISKKEASTQVLVKDGDTTVIGGIYTRQQGVDEAAVPVFSKIPVLGWLFKKKKDTDNRTELLVFITPRIINRNQVVASEAPAQ